MKLTKVRKALLFVILASVLPGQEPESISFAESRPLAKIARQLVIRYGYLINSEEAPYGQEDLRTEEPVPGHRVIGPAYKPMKFLVRSRFDRTVAAPDGRNQRTSPVSELVPRLVKEYNESGNPGRFSSFVDGEHNYIVPVARTVKGREQRVAPILGVKVSLEPGEQSCYEKLRELLAKIQNLRGERIVIGNFSFNRLMNLRCEFHGSELTARQALMQLLDQMCAPNPNAPQCRFVYDLNHDAKTNAYFLNSYQVILPEPAPSETNPGGGSNPAPQPAQVAIPKPQPGRTLDPNLANSPTVTPK